jgi:hypothetical protein
VRCFSHVGVSSGSSRLCLKAAEVGLLYIAQSTGVWVGSKEKTRVKITSRLIIRISLEPIHKTEKLQICKTASDFAEHHSTVLRAFDGRCGCSIAISDSVFKAVAHTPKLNVDISGG